LLVPQAVQIVILSENLRLTAKNMISRVVPAITLEVVAAPP
jgi:hypothetical protein